MASPEYIDEHEAVDVCYEEFMKCVNWFCDGIEAGHEGKIASKNDYARYLILEFARRIDKGDTNGFLENG